MYFLNESDRDKLQALINKGNRSVAKALYRRRRSTPGGRTLVSGGTTSTVEIRFGLLEEDIPGVVFEEEDNKLQSTDFPLTQAQIDDGITTIFQDPSSDDLTENIKSEFPVFPYKRTKISVKEFKQPEKTVIHSGEMVAAADDTITLAFEASDEDFVYQGKWIEVNDDGEIQKQKITSYSGGTRIATVETDWFPTLNPGTTYQIIQQDPGYDEDEDGVPIPMGMLRTTVELLREGSGDPYKQVIRYVYFDAYSDERGGFTRDSYQMSDYPGYLDVTFPPDGEGAYEEEDDDYFKKNYMIMTINGTIVVIFCLETPPPPLRLKEGS